MKISVGKLQWNFRRKGISFPLQHARKIPFRLNALQTIHTSKAAVVFFYALMKKINECLTRWLSFPPAPNP